MSATLRKNDDAFALDDNDLDVLNTKLKAAKWGQIIDIPETELLDRTGTTLEQHDDWKRAIIYITKPRNAAQLFKKLIK